MSVVEADIRPRGLDENVIRDRKRWRERKLVATPSLWDEDEDKEERRESIILAL